MPTEHRAIHFDPAEFPAEPMACLRCGTAVPMQFRGLCPGCGANLNLEPCTCAERAAKSAAP